jgi:hypothetical protein
VEIGVEDSTDPKPYGRGYRRQLAELVVATGWAPTFYADTFDTRDLTTIVAVLEKQNKQR